MSITRSSAPKARATERPAAALLLWGHGAQGGPGVIARIAERLALDGRFAEVGASCLRGRPRLADALARIVAPEIHLVPMLLADGYLARTALAAEIAGLGADAARLRPTPVLGDNPKLARLIARQAGAAARHRRWASAESTLLLVGHGTPREPASRRTLLAQAARLRRQACFGAVATAFLEDRPSVMEALTPVAPGPVVAVGFFMEAGPHGGRDVRRALTETGRAVAYAGVVGESPELADLVLAQVAASERPTEAA